MRSFALLAALLLIPACSDETAPATSTSAATSAGTSTGAGGRGQGGAGGSGGSDDLTVWPNAQSLANSDPWLSDHHAEITQLRPKLLVLNFVNAKDNSAMLAELDTLIAAIREGSRYHGTKDAVAPAMLAYQIGKAVDLRDADPPADYPYRNSSKYPREEPKEGYWSFDYAKLFSPEFAAYYDIPSPVDGHPMDLCELVNEGVIQEVWVYGDADIPDVSAAEILELKAEYGADGKRLPGEPMDPCAGNGCFDTEDLNDLPGHCTRSLRIGWVNNTRGPGCFLESIDHGFESTASRGVVPYLADTFLEFVGFDLDTRYGTPFSSFYACSDPNCLSYPGPETVAYYTQQGSGVIDPYVPVCGNAHIPPNGRFQYDFDGSSPDLVHSTCEHFRMLDGDGGLDKKEDFTGASYSLLNSVAPDCGGGFHLYWMQNFPGLGNQAYAIDGSPMLPWWPFLYY